MFEAIKAKKDAEYARKKHFCATSDPVEILIDRLPASSSERERKPIQITLPDGTVKEGTSCETSPMAIAMGISKGLAERTVIAQVNGELWDLDRPLEESCKLELLDFEHEKGR